MADRKISDLTALTTPATGDLLPIVDISEAAAADKNKSITVGELLRGAPDGTAAAPGIAFESDGGNGMFLGGTDILAFSTGGTQAVTIDASQRLGVGTTSPLTEVQIGSNGYTGELASGYRTLSIADTSNGAQLQLRGLSPKLFFDSSSGGNGEIYMDATALAVFSGTPNTPGTERLRIDSSGRVGIGNSSPGSFYSGSNQLVVGNTGDQGITIKTGTSDTGRLHFADGTTGNEAYRGRIEYLHSSDLMRFGTAGSSSHMVIDSSGRVGIGVASPGTNLHIVGTAGTGDLANGQVLRLDGGTISAADTGVGLAFTRTGSQLAFIQARRENASDEAGYLAFATQTSAGSHPERMRIDSSGRLLVGTSSARSNFHNSTNIAYQLQVEGTDYFNSSPAFISNSTTASYGPHVTIARSRGSAVGSNGLVNEDDVIGVLNFQGNDGSEFVNCGRIRCHVDGTAAANDMPGRLTFETTSPGQTSTTERMRIGSDGRITYNFNGSSNLDVFIDNSAGAPTMDFNRANTTSTSTCMRFRNFGTIVGSITYTNSATAFNTSSDYRLKENVVPVSDGIDRLKQLKPSRFNFIVDPDKTVDGFIAHEAQAVVPEAVTGTKDEVDENGDPVMQGIDQSKLVPLLTAALQEAIAKIETLEAKVAALEAN